jgi:2-polyprenyl-6-methoxyphenol hydroxylase-like FAD-dependent oxidoreductase
MSKKKDYAIIGAGIGGLTLAVALRRKGIPVTVYETAPRLKPLGAGLGLAGNAMKAFAEIGLDKEIMRVSHVLEQVSILNPRGKPLMITDSKRISRTYGVANNFTVHRADLHEVLLSELPKDCVKLDKALVDLTQSNDGVTLKFKDGTAADVGYVVGADGIHSVVRRHFLPNVTPRYAGYTAYRAVVENPGPDFNYSLTSETWGAGARFGIVPMTNNRVYWFACVNATQNDALMRSLTPSDLLAYFGNFHSPVPDLIRRTSKESLLWNDIIDLPPIAKFAFGNVVLMGDAAHATTPNLGQGACMAIEDAVVLANMIGAAAAPEEAFMRFQEKRMPRTSRIVRDSWQIGKMAQLENPILSVLRNLALKFTPPAVADKQFRFIYDVSFN